ncbi:DUF2958 domain-containing protein [Anabaena azotica FACHB-119]|uniref:DUF2958 domain-containing protein n=2 Tax=Anabaena azotica TaxID=197653 RepID=A0ABR8D9K9_9NOST|nr:DUF2958 domain-containing protein [Anabaena azotica FACHB-119]
MQSTRLLTPEIIDQLPELYSQEKVTDPLVHIKFFAPESSWSWYVIEYDKEDEDTLFGLVNGFEEELGYFSLSELEEYRSPLGLGVERDLSFVPTRLSDLRRQLSQLRKNANT